MSTPVPDDDGDHRCVVHPSRLAHDACPVCARPRCAADAEAAPGGGCLVCRGTADVGRGRPPVDLRALVGAAVVAQLAAYGAGVVGSEYVDVKWFSTIVPLIGGIVCGAAAEKGAGRARGTGIRVVAISYALLAAALAFRFVPGEDFRLQPLPYLAAALGAWLWTAPPRAAKRPATHEGADEQSADDQERATRSK